MYYNCILLKISVITYGQETPSFEVGISDDLVHIGNEASITYRVQNQGSYKSEYQLANAVKLNINKLTH